MHLAISDEGTTWSVKEWSDWIAQRVQDREKIFMTDPDEMGAAYNRETGYARDYHGRELLELLQNADDAGMECERSRAIVMLSHSGLCVGNTGKTFSAAGVKSLMISDNSPKQLNRTRYIGNRGLGFRSILSWTDCPFILSGNLSLGFDRRRAKEWLEQLCLKDANLRKKADEMRQAGKSSPIPTLSFPFTLGNDRDIKEVKPSEENFPAIWSLAQSLRSQGYDTVIALPFATDTTFEEVQTQLNQMGQEILLFLKNLCDFTLHTPDREEAWHVERHDKSIAISSSDSNTLPQTWQVFETNGTIPSDLLSRDQQVTPDYEIKLVIPKQVPGSDFLFNYFPTQARFPFPLIVHATFELTNNRQSLVESRANKFIAKKMAKFMAEVAEKSHDPEDPWRSLSIIAAKGDVDPILAKLGFSEALIDAAKLQNLIPVRGGQLLNCFNAFRLKYNVKDWLPRDGFEDIVLWTDDVSLSKSLESLGVQILDQNAFRDRLNRLSTVLSLTDRIALIAGLVKSSLMPKNPCPNLLIDDNGEVIPADYVTFLPPADSVSLHLPPWMALRMLHGGFATTLREKLGIGTLRELSHHLSMYRVQEYALTPLASTINARTNEKIEDDPDHELEYRIVALRAIFQLYSRSRDTDVPKRPNDLRIQVPKRLGGVAPADTLYFGQEYDCGIITEFLFGQICPDKIVATPSILQLDADAGKITQFLRWMGVADQPRELVRERCNDSAFQEYVKSKLNYPVEFNPPEFAYSPDDLRWAQLVNVTDIESLEDFIKYIDPHVILAWMSVDGRLENWRSVGDSAAKIERRSSRQVNHRVMQGQKIPSYVIWRLQLSEWLPTSNGHRRAPSQCTLTSALPDDVKAILPRPAINYEHNVFKRLSIDRIRLRSSLERVGVKPSLDDISWDDFYSLLLELPQRDPEGRSARTLYRTLIAKSEGEVSPSGAQREKFLKEGQLWGKRGDSAQYFGIGELFYVEYTSLPDPVCREIPLLDFDRRRGAQKIQRLFGVEPLDNRKIDLVIDYYEPSPRASELDSEFEQLKPFVYAMRIDADSNKTEQKRLVALEIKLCRSVEGRAKVGDREISISLRAPGDVIRDENTAYLVAEPNEPGHILKDELTADAIGEILAGVLRVERGSDFARLASCSVSRREALLERILGFDAKELLLRARISVELKDDDNGKIEEMPPWVEPPQINTPPKRFESEASSQLPTKMAPKSGDEHVGAVQSKEITRIPSPPQRKISMRVRATSSAPSGLNNIPRVVDPVRCQEVASRFEEAEGQNRFPLPVDHLQGTEAYGCDILSFGTEENREQFKKHPDLGLVERFIEVKGRSSEHGKIELNGNELKAAQEHREKFYIYRVYERKEFSEFEIMVLDDPTATNCDVTYNIDLSRTEKTRYWHVSEISNINAADTNGEAS